MKNKLANITNNHLHTSYSQVWTYLNCSLKYYFRYVRGEQRQHTSIALIFGSALHKALERFYQDAAEGKTQTSLATLQTVFSEYITADISSSQIPVLYKKDTPDQDSAKKIKTKKESINMGQNMLEAAYDRLPLPKGYIVAGVEVPVAAPLVTPQGQPVDMMLTGIVDLVLMDRNMQPIVVDFKTAKQTKSQTVADDDIQMSVYQYLMGELGYNPSEKPLECQFWVFRKLKKPKLEIVTTIRTNGHRARLVKLLNSVLAGIENRVFIPNKGWLCGDCEYSQACKTW